MSSMRVCSRSDPIGRVHRVVRDAVAGTSTGDPRPVSAHPPQGERLQPRRIRPGPAGPACRLARRALAIQPGKVDRRLGRDSGGRRCGRTQARPATGRSGAGCAFVRDHHRLPSIAWPRSSRPGPVAVEMLDRMILDLAAQNPSYRRASQLRRGPPAAVLAAQFYADSPEELAEHAEIWRANFEGRPGVLGFASDLLMPTKTTSGRFARRDFRS